MGKKSERIRVIERFLETLYPSNIYCISCGALIDQSRKYALCDSCIMKIGWVKGRTCMQCGKELHRQNKGAYCYDCENNVFFFDRGYTCTRYGLYERSLLSDCKFRDQSHIARKIGEIMAARIALEKLDFQCIVGVPLHPTKRKKREYNQVDIMGKMMAKKLRVPYCSSVLLRNRNTKSMKALSAYERRKNVEGAFSVISEKKDRLKGRHILLIDDIYTTGSTLNACGKTLKQQGQVKEITVLTFAAGSDGFPQSL